MFVQINALVKLKQNFALNNLKQTMTVLRSVISVMRHCISVPPQAIGGIKLISSGHWSFSSLFNRSQLLL